MLWPLLTLNSSILSLIWSGTAYFVVNYTVKHFPTWRPRSTSELTNVCNPFLAPNHKLGEKTFIFSLSPPLDPRLAWYVFATLNSFSWIMNAISNEKRPTSMTFYIRPTGTQIFRGFKVHNVITCESKVQVVVSLGRHWVLFAPGRHWVLTNGTWHVLLQSGNVFELGGITNVFITK